ncbi:DUF5123 domain-containing protein [Dysgonomonas sp. 520]|uniref:DUF5123 domain-containing protein n=1 Tax=Dysgonomonas sp. 520 TaxID=2302931 RepID=UPI0013D2A343|nr:DUF5123 domain-containing protein [Dysgonomonas sp. 520]NDW08697.1 DUF5123 domain-containing protein [Dysgonomonas sp. 520]
MKSLNIIKNIAGCLLVAYTALFTLSCDDDVNDWGVDSSQDRLFRPLVFEQSKVSATSIEVRFTKVMAADRYIFEISEDSLKFENVIRTVEILSDTLTPFSLSSTATKTEFRIPFDELNGSTQQCIRMKAVNKEGTLSSEYVEFAFKTTEENIFKEFVIGADEFTAKWEQTDRITRIEVIEDASGEDVLADGNLSDQEIANAEKTVSGLKMGTYYTVTLYNGDKIRGRHSLKTAGTAGSESYNVQPGDDIAAVLQELLDLGTPNVSLIFENGQAYDLQTLEIPAGMVSVTFTASSGEKPILNMNKVVAASTMDALVFENVNLVGESAETSRFIDTKVGIRNISFTGCSISDYNCIIRLQNTPMEVDKVLVDRCFIKNTGSYGVFNVGGAQVQLKDLELKESTLVDVGTQLTDIRTNAELITVKQCTFYNGNAKMNQFFRFDKNNLPALVVVEKCLLSGANADGKVNATYQDYLPALSISFAGTYRSSDFQENNRKFADITVFEGTASELFTNPDNDEFFIKPGSGFAGEGVVGDPRWF